MRRAIRTAGAWLPLVAAIPFLLLALAFGAAAIWGGQVRTIVSSSMEPSISRGSLIMVVPVEQPVPVGTVVVFPDPFNESRIIAHRVIEIVRSSSGEVNYRTRGDANPREDARPIPDRELIGRVRIRIPVLGGLLQSVHTIPGAAVVMGLPVLALILDRRSRRRSGTKKARSEVALQVETKHIGALPAPAAVASNSEADILLVVDPRRMPVGADT